MRRWICPECQDGLNAPERMRRNDSRRFCLVCSAKAPYLIERKCPVLESRRLRKRGARATKKKRITAQLDTLPYRGRDDLIQKDYQRFIRLKCWPTLWETVGSLAIRRSAIKNYSTGRCWSNGEICATLSATAIKSEVHVLLLHELAHAASPRGEHHGDTWRAFFVESVREVFGELDYEGAADYIALHYNVEQAARKQEQSV